MARNGKFIINTRIKASDIHYVKREPLPPNDTIKIVPLETDLECSICGDEFKLGDFGSAIEAGRNRRFCPGCFSDLLRTSDIKDNDFIDD
jgi:hypothetical protein